jgi:short-subunit dehydrogenase
MLAPNSPDPSPDDKTLKVVITSASHGIGAQWVKSVIESDKTV